MLGQIISRLAEHFDYMPLPEKAREHYEGCRDLRKLEKIVVKQRLRASRDETRLERIANKEYTPREQRIVEEIKAKVCPENTLATGARFVGEEIVRQLRDLSREVAEDFFKERGAQEIVYNDENNLVASINGVDIVVHENYVPGFNCYGCGLHDLFLLTYNPEDNGGMPKVPETSVRRQRTRDITISGEAIYKNLDTGLKLALLSTERFRFQATYRRKQSNFSSLYQNGVQVAPPREGYGVSFKSTEFWTKAFPDSRLAKEFDWEHGTNYSGCRPASRDITANQAEDARWGRGHYAGRTGDPFVDDPFFNPHAPGCRFSMRKRR